MLLAFGAAWMFRSPRLFWGRDERDMSCRCLSSSEHHELLHQKRSMLLVGHEILDCNMKSVSSRRYLNISLSPPSQPFPPLSAYRVLEQGLVSS